MKNAVVIRTIGTLKSEPNEFSESVDEVLFGMNVEILHKLSNNWFYVKTHYNYEGFIKADNLLIDDEKSMLWVKEKNAVVTNSFADILINSETSGYIIKSLTRGANLIAVNEISENKRFIKVRMPNLETGWIRKSFISKLKENYDLSNEKNLRENLAKSAISYLGTQYRWGGKTPLGIDCSGLCSMAYLLNGIIIYRDAEIKEGFPIKEIIFKKLKMGDLIFFPGHVAMYLENGNYIHSSTSNDVVKINSFNKNDPNYNEYLGKSTKKFGSIF